MNEQAPSCPDGIEVVPFGESTWRYRYPTLDQAVRETFYEILDEWRAGAPFDHVDRRFRQLIDAYPEYIDARHHLAMLLGEMGRADEAHDLWERTVADAMACLPDAFRMGEDKMPWFELDNRPFLRAYHGLALDLANRGEVHQAYEMFHHILVMNPSDNQGARALAVEFAFYLERPTDVLDVCKRYPNDILPQILYGRSLAHYQLDHHEEAEVALSRAVDRLPKIAEELVKERHEKPETFREDRVTIGGDDEAYHYWIDNGPYWERIPGAIGWVRDYLERQQNGR